MNFYREPKETVSSRFRPPLVGCVARDRQLAIALSCCYTDTFASIAAQIYRSLITAGHDSVLSDLFDRMATEELEQLRTLGELIVALGGEGLPYLSGRTPRRETWRRSTGGSALEACMAEKRRNIDRYETLMSRTGDRVVRSVISRLLSGERRMLSRLGEYTGEKDCDCN